MARGPPVADRFVREAVATLSVQLAGDEERLFDEIYAGVEWQRMRLRNDQRLEEWSGLGLAHLSYAVRAPPRRRAEPVDDPVVQGYLDEHPAIAVAANDTSGLQHLGESELGGATEIDHGRGVHSRCSLTIKSCR
jgi:hypothetical protein